MSQNLENTASKSRCVIENVQPEIDCGRFPIKRAVGEKVIVQADVFADGHDVVNAGLLYKMEANDKWIQVPMYSIGNDRWESSFVVEHQQTYLYTVVGWINYFKAWQQGLLEKDKAGQNVNMTIKAGLEYISLVIENSSEIGKQKLEKWFKLLKKSTEKDFIALSTSEELLGLISRYSKRSLERYPKELKVTVDRQRAVFGAWYEFFPRSFGTGKHGTFRDCEKLLPYISEMGFDIIYLPPIHPIGLTNRKGKNNSTTSKHSDVGSPWAIGSSDGGHKTIHPELGTLNDFEKFAKKTKEYKIQIAMDLAFQCSRDHPYIKEHPEWFNWLADGTIHYAENPPKKYEDIVAFNFESQKRQELWYELKSIVMFWIGKGVKIFRVDNPHTKPFKFWEWLIAEIKYSHPEVILLSEAFTRPKVMYRLAKVGFTQSYTYFTWRTEKNELIKYITELTQTELREYFRPNLWANTPDILSTYLQEGGRPASIIRLALAATLSSNYGIYGPAYELCANKPIEPGKEEYLDSEKYEIKKWEINSKNNLKEIVTRINKIRRENTALQTTHNIRFCDVKNDKMLCYVKATSDLSNVLLVIVNLDPFQAQGGWLRIPLEALNIKANQQYLVHDLLGDEKYTWKGEWNYVELNPKIVPVQIFKIQSKHKRENDFDYFG